MELTQFLLTALTAVAASSHPPDDREFFSVLLKRQEPDTAAYNCHDNCGTDDACDSEAFVSNYNCLQCAGLDNVDIWQYYGNSLSAAGESCGFDTQPLSGEQDDVGPAIPADSDDGGHNDDSGDDDDSANGERPSSDDGSLTGSGNPDSPSATSPPDAEPTDDGESTGNDDGESSSETDDESEAPTSGNNEESASPSESTDIPETGAAGTFKGGFAGIAVAAVCGSGLLM
ncbi:hypothetical protein VUR80DRAFT_3711 [Thermomyces stellatus]